MFWARKYSSGHKACMLGLRAVRHLEMNRYFPLVCICLLGLTTVAPTGTASAVDDKSAQALVAALQATSVRLESLQGDTLRDMRALEREAQAKEALLSDLARVLEDAPVETQQSFAAMRGKLPWACCGKNEFGPFWRQP